MGVVQYALTARSLFIAAPLALSLIACAPKFKSEGSLTVGGAPFAPASCRVMAESFGVELSAGAARVELTLPPRNLNAFQEVNGTPHVRIAPAGQAVRDLGSCGSLILKGEGYHGDGRRAVSGHVSLACPDASGELDFTGCF